MNIYKSKVTTELVKCAKFLYTDAGRTGIEALVGEGNVVFSKHRHPSSVASATITLPERKITMTEGDWLVKNDTFSVCSNDVFQQLYTHVPAVEAVEVVVEVEAPAEPVAEVEAPTPVQAVEVVEVEVSKNNTQDVLPNSSNPPFMRGKYREKFASDVSDAVITRTQKDDC